MFCIFYVTEEAKNYFYVAKIYFSFGIWSLHMRVSSQFSVSYPVFRNVILYWLKKDDEKDLSFMLVCRESWFVVQKRGRLCQNGELYLHRCLKDRNRSAGLFRHVQSCSFMHQVVRSGEIHENSAIHVYPVFQFKVS